MLAKQLWLARLDSRLCSNNVLELVLLIEELSQLIPETL